MWDGLAGNVSNYRVSNFFAVELLSWVVFLLEAPVTYPASFFKPKHFYCKEVIQMCWNISLPVKTLKTTYYFNTPCFKDQLFQHSLSLNPYHSQTFLLHVSEDLHFHPLRRGSLWFRSSHDGGKVGAGIWTFVLLLGEASFGFPTSGFMTLITFIVSFFPYTVTILEEK